MAHRNDIFLIKDSLENKISYYHLAAFLIMLPFDRFYSEIIFISFTAHVIIHLNKTKIEALFSLQTIILIALFLVNVIGTIYSSDKASAFNDLERQLALLLFPLLIPASGLNVSKYKNALLKIFGFICVLTILYLFIHAIRVVLYNHLPIAYLFSTSLTNHNFSAPIDMHATYLSMYVSLSLICFISFFLKQPDRSSQIICGGCILILLAGLVQLASRAVFISTLFIILILFPVLIDTKTARRKFLLIAVPIVLITFIGIYRADWLRKRYTSELKDDLTQTSINNEIIEPRITRWRVAWKLFQEHPIIGYGSGMEKKVLMDQYFEEKLYNSYLNKLNAHNQYLSVMLKTGLWGLLIFLITLIYGFLAAWYSRDIVFAGFMVLITFVSLSENILDVNKTIFFFSFFFSLFIYSSKQTLEVNNIFNLKKGKSPAIN